MKGKTLLEQAKEVRLRHKQAVITDEQIELALAWARDEVTMKQVGIVVMDLTGNTGATNNIYNWLAIRLREAFRRGYIK